MCVQNFDDSRGLAIRITYRISLRSSSLWEPRHPLLKVVLVVRAASESGPAETTSHSNQESFRSATKPQQGKQAEATTQHQTGTHASQPPPAQECPSTAERKCAFPRARFGRHEPPSRTTQLPHSAGPPKHQRSTKPKKFPHSLPPHRNVHQPQSGSVPFPAQGLGRIPSRPEPRRYFGPPEMSISAKPEARQSVPFPGPRRPLPNCSLATSQMTRPEAKKAIPTETSRAHRLCI